jgi:hypothetical protein
VADGFRLIARDDHNLRRQLSAGEELPWHFPDRFFRRLGPSDAMCAFILT